MRWLCSIAASFTSRPGAKRPTLSYDAMAAGEMAVLEKSYPQVSCGLIFRSAPERSCLEDYAIMK
jgi:hypothetical protein